MAKNINMADKLIERRERSARRQKLFEIIKLILDGKIDSEKTPLAGIFNQKGPRKTYVSPQNRGSNNSGYMEISDFSAGNMFVE